MEDTISVNTKTHRERYLPCPWCSKAIKFDNVTEPVRVETVRCPHCKKPIEKWSQIEVNLSVIGIEECDLG